MYYKKGIIHASAGQQVKYMHLHYHYLFEACRTILEGGGWGGGGGGGTFTDDV